MGYLHQVVVYYIGKVIGREAIALHDYEMIFGMLLSVRSINEILNTDGAGATFEAHGVDITSRSSCSRLLGGDSQAGSRIEPRGATRLE